MVLSRIFGLAAIVLIVILAWLIAAMGVWPDLVVGSDYVSAAYTLWGLVAAFTAAALYETYTVWWAFPGRRTVLLRATLAAATLVAAAAYCAFRLNGGASLVTWPSSGLFAHGEFLLIGFVSLLVGEDVLIGYGEPPAWWFRREAERECRMHLRRISMPPHTR